MKFILDTHSFLWFISDDKKISILAKQLIENIENVRLISVASLWEIAIKQSLGKLELQDDYEKFMSDQLKKNQIVILTCLFWSIACKIRKRWKELLISYLQNV